jgi:L-iditol 2-dehydrogenase
VLVFGVGTIGLLACALAKCYGASRVVAIDINRARLDFARRNGFATDTYHVPKMDKAKTSEEQLRRAEKSIRDALLELDQSDGFDVVFECSGAESCVQMGCHAATTGGKVMLIGMGSSKIMFPLAAVSVREVDVLGCFRYANTYPAALSLLASGKLKNVEKLITHRFSLEEVGHAFEILSRGEDDDGNMVIKVIITASP